MSRKNTIIICILGCFLLLWSSIYRFQTSSMLPWEQTNKETHASTLTITKTLSDSQAWNMILSEEHPYSSECPRLNVLWSRGWYTNQLFPEWITLNYYNSIKPKGANNFWSKWNMDDIFKPTTHSFSNTYLWVRREADLDHFFLNSIWNQPFTNLTLVTTDGDGDIPNDSLLHVLSDDRLHMWYSQNMIWYGHPKLQPLPIGLDIHTAFTPGGETPVATIRTMQQIRQHTKPQRTPRRILYDHGTTTKSQAEARRNDARTELANAVASCNTPDKFTVMTKTNKIAAWKIYGSEQFGLAPTGMGYDTHRMWELLLFGTIPIVKSSPLDVLIIDAHLPIIIMEDWSELCTFDADAMYKIYGGVWMEHVHEWLQPGIWLPRNQKKMDDLCDAIPKCRTVYESRKHLLQKW